MIRRSSVIAIEIVGFLLAGAVVLVGLGAWRLSSGPIELEMLTPYLQEALSRGSTQVSMGGTSLRWGGFNEPLALVATDVLVRGGDGRTVARLPAVSLSFGVRELVQGRMVPSRVELVEPRVRVERAESGALRFGLGDAEASADPSGAGVIETLLKALQAAPGDTGQPLAALETLSVTRGQVLVDDRMLGVSWYAPLADIDLRRTVGGVEGAARLEVQIGDRTARIDADLDYSAERGETEAEVRIDNIVPAMLASIDPVLAPLEILASPVRGTVNATFGPTFVPRQARFSLAAGAGALRLDGVFPEPLRVARIDLAGSADLPGGTMVIERFAADLGGPRLEASATIVDRAGTLEVEGTTAVTMLPTDLIASYWPPAAGVHARNWVTGNLSRGIVRRAEAHLRAHAPADDVAGLTVADLEGSITFDGVTVNYLDGMPPVTDVSGTARFDRGSFTITTEGGRLRDLSVTGAEIALTDLDTRSEKIDIQVVVTGPVSTTLAVIDSPPLGYASAIGVAPGAAGGAMSARLRFAFPLKRGLQFTDVALAAAANLRGVRLDGIGGGLAVRDLDGALSLDGRGLELTGDLALAGVPAAVEWTERFAAAPGPRRRVRLTGTLDGKARAALGLPTFEGIDGPVPVTVSYVAGDGATTLDADLDLTEARLSVDRIGWAKAPGVPGQAQLSFVLDADNQLRRLAAFTVDAGGLKAHGDADFVPGTTEFAALRIPEVVQGRSRFGLFATRQPNGGLAVELRGAGLDIGPAFDAFGGRPAAAGAASAPLQATIQMDRLYFGSDDALHGANGLLVRRGGAWDAIDIAARTDTGAPVRLQYGEADDGVVRLQMSADDAGAALRALGLFGTVRGGRLSVTGQEVAAPGGAAFAGSIRMSDFRLVRAPALARLLAALSLGGLNDLLTSNGIDFTRLVADYRLENDVLTIAGARTSGNALGLTLDGKVDFASSRLDVDGTIVPLLMGVNQVVGAIPIIGDLLTGGEGQGVFAFTYGIEGPLAEPTVTVNPLAVLAPGFLRNLFFLDSGGTPPPRPPPAEVD